MVGMATPTTADTASVPSTIITITITTISTTIITTTITAENITEPQAENTNFFSA
jgi:hypothetical protein